VLATIAADIVGNPRRVAVKARTHDNLLQIVDEVTRVARKRACYICMHMEKPAVISPRVYKRHRAIIERAANKLKVSEAEIVRRALEAFAF
jgi:hypothetical protein